MSLESHQRQTVIRILSPLHAISVENSCLPGTPDVCFSAPWLELKTADRWPVRADTVLKEGVDIKKFTYQQRIFARVHRRAQGFHCVCLLVDKDWFLIEGVAAADHLGIDWTKQDIIDNSWQHWLGGLDKPEFFKAILTATERSRGWHA